MGFVQYGPVKNLKKPIVYIVDDDEANRDALRTLFRTIDVDVQSFSSAEDFLERGFDRKHVCLVADVDLPGQSGIQLLEQLKKSDRSIPTILLDSGGDVQRAVQAMRIGVIDYIEKPFVNRILVKRVREALDLTC